LTKFDYSVNLLSGSFSFHRHILPLGGWCRNGTSHLTFCLKSKKIYNEQAIAIRAAGSTYQVATLRNELRSLQVERTPDSVFRTHLNELVYKTRSSNKPVKYFLMTLEHYSRWYNDGAIGRPKCKDTTRVFDFANTTIEHIYPQNPDNPIQELEGVLNNLGNLTFLGPDDNNAAGNKPFEEKRSIFQVSSVSLNRDIAKNDSWDKAKVEERQEDLTEMALKVFSV
jgi:hypothetical protein